MTNLRQGRWLQVFSDACSAKSSLAAAALLGTLLAAPGPALAAPPHSHARRPLPTSLHSYTVADTSSHSGAKKRKGSLKSKAADREPTGAHPTSKGKSKSHGRHTEPVDDPVPMFRAGHDGRVRPGAHGGAMFSATNRHGRYGNQPAPLVSSNRHGHAVETASHTRAGSAREVRGNGRTYASVSGGWHPLSETRLDAPRPAPIVRRAPSTVASNSTPVRPETFAEGVSHPEDDERMPRQGLAAGNGAGYSNAATPNSGAPLPAAHVSAAPRVPAATIPTSPVVQGFGGEVALPSPAPSSSQERPGGTHRRNHPSNWSPEPAAFNSEPLEEREAITDAAISPSVLPETYDRNGRLMMPAPLKGSHDVLVHQNMMADNDGLERVQNDADLERLRAAHRLVSLPESDSLHVNEDIPAARRVARPWTVLFAGDIGRAFYARFREPIYVTSAVRTVQYQARLQRINGNAAGLWGDSASPHLTGQAVDLGKGGMSSAELAWMRGYLLPLMQAGKIDVEEEFHQACFHISVYRSYAAGRRMPVQQVAQVRSAAPAQAAPVSSTNDAGDSPDEQ